MTTQSILIGIAVAAVVTFILRALPFIAFHGDKKMPKWLERLGQLLPATIMAVLIVYCLKDIGGDFVGVGIPKLIGVAVVFIVHKLKHNMLLSVFSGTAVYMLILYIMKLM
ncbi:MAG: branched-chain amino acid transporter permease [Ruminiclostridium sp.]